MGIKNKAFIICFLLVLTVFWCPLKMTWAVPASYQAIQDLKEAERQGPAVVFEVPQVEYTASNLRDPFEPEPVKGVENGEEDKTSPPPPHSPLPHLTIQGIVWGSPSPQAIIDNQVVNLEPIPVKFIQDALQLLNSQCFRYGNHNKPDLIPEEVHVLGRQSLPPLDDIQHRSPAPPPELQLGVDPGGRP